MQLLVDTDVGPRDQGPSGFALAKCGWWALGALIEDSGQFRGEILWLNQDDTSSPDMLDAMVLFSDREEAHRYGFERNDFSPSGVWTPVWLADALRVDRWLKNPRNRIRITHRSGRHVLDRKIEMVGPRS